MIGKTTLSRKIFNIFNYSLMLGLSFLFIVPLWHVIMSSISEPRLLMASNGLLLKPLGELTLEGYRSVLANSSIKSGYFNTIIYVSGTTLLGLVLTILAGYVLSRKKMKLKVPMTIFVLFTMMFNGGLIPTYMVIRSLGFIGTRWSILIPGVTNAFYIIIMKSAFEQIPNSFEESAKIDGADPLVIMLKILVPLVKSTMAVVILFNVVMQWNSWYPPSIYLSTQRELWPLQLVMREIIVLNKSAIISDASDVADKADYTKNLAKYCTVIVGTLPVLAIYPFLQKYFVKGVTLGGVKG